MQWAPIDWLAPIVLSCGVDMLKKIFSVFGVVVIVAFFLPWLKSCSGAESGFELLVLRSFTSFGSGSISSLNAGCLFVLVPLYIVLAAWLSDRILQGRGLKMFFGIISALSLWNIGLWCGLFISAIKIEWGTMYHKHAMTLSKLVGVLLLGAIFLSVYLLRWGRSKRFDFAWSEFVLIFPLIGVMGFGLTFTPRFYGFYIALGALICLAIGAAAAGIADAKRSGGQGTKILD